MLLAVGRDPNTKVFQNVKDLKMTSGKKIIGNIDEPEQTSVPSIYAIGDVVEGIPELMPVA